MHRRDLLLAAASAALAGCAASAQSAPPVTLPAPPPPPAPPTGAATNGAFDVSLYRALATQPGNQFVSPYSVSAAFSLLYPGARGMTASEIAAVLGYDASSAAATANARAVAQALLANAGGSTFELANAAWVERTMALEADYARTIREELGGTIEALDFIGNPRGALDRINHWASDNTHERIPEILTEPDPRRRLVLTNAVYFKGKWTHPFTARSTQDGTFHAATGAVPARLMRQLANARYFETDAFQAADFDYDQGAFALAVFLPRENSSLAAFERELTGAHLDDWMQRLTTENTPRLDLTLPKVQMRTSYDLAVTLRDMGMRQAFTNGADFSGVTQAEHLAISAVIHKTFLAIDEDGTEAAAVTAIDMRATAAMAPPPPPPIVFRADRPFFIVLHHKPTRTRLFMGRIATVAA